MNPQVQQAIDNINQFIVENHNNEITADVLNPILIEIANLWDDLVGDLSDSSVDGDTIIEMINQLQQEIEDITGLKVHTGQPDPNVTPPSTYSAPDLYVRLSMSNIPYEVYIYNGIKWVLIDSGITKTSEQWTNFILSGLGGLPTLVGINENQRFINITGNPSASSLGGYHIGGGSIPTSIFWSGMAVKVHNATASNQVIKHNYSSATIKFLFPKEEDYTIKPGETVIFTYRGGALEFENTSNITLEQARQNGNVLEGDVIFDSSEPKTGFKNQAGFIGFTADGYPMFNYEEGEEGINGQIINYGNSIAVIQEENGIGIVGNEEFDKQGDRKAFAQIADVEDYISELTVKQTIFTQYTESTLSGDDGSNLIQPDLGLPILEVDDLQEDSSYNGELVLNIDNNSVATTKVITLFGAEIYNNTNPSSEITSKITYTLNFFNQAGDDIDYKLSWEYLSSGEILFGEHTDTIDNTSDVDFELLVTGHSTDDFNLKKARLWRN